MSRMIYAFVMNERRDEPKRLREVDLAERVSNRELLATDWLMRFYERQCGEWQYPGRAVDSRW